jgi:hypothetical protein
VKIVRRAGTVADGVSICQEILARHPAPLYIATRGRNISERQAVERKRYQPFCSFLVGTRHVWYIHLALMKKILNHSNVYGKKEILTTARARTTNSREPNIAKIILLR